MRYRKLRIAWSVVWGLIVVLLIVLWVHGYLSIDYTNFGSARLGSFDMISHRGEMWLNWTDVQPASTFELGAIVPDSGIELPEPTAVGFAFERDFSTSVHNWCVSLPTWFLVVSSIVGGAAPWTHQLRLRFSLRTLLIATTLVAVVLGLIVWQVRR